MKGTLFLSDLHLAANTPQIAQNMIGLLRQMVGQVQAVYVLGDLFDAWIGDDAITPAHAPILDSLLALREQDVRCFFMHGNRDFLVGQQFAVRTGCDLLNDPTVIDLYGVPTLLMHGDLLCTDDLVYQKIRAQVRDPRWQAHALSLSIEQRLQMAREARDQSAQYKGTVQDEIMDANTQTVIDTMNRYAVKRLIHGHTHRPAIHTVPITLGSGQRIVLGDWSNQRMSYLLVTEHSLSLHDPRVPTH